jgi:hypothetical protein
MVSQLYFLVNDLLTVIVSFISKTLGGLLYQLSFCVIDTYKNVFGTFIVSTYLQHDRRIITHSDFISFSKYLIMYRFEHK